MMKKIGEVRHAYTEESVRIAAPVLMQVQPVPASNLEGAEVTRSLETRGQHQDIEVVEGSIRIHHTAILQRVGGRRHTHVRALERRVIMIADDRPLAEIGMAGRDAPAQFGMVGEFAPEPVLAQLLPGLVRAAAQHLLAG
ncbi:MAG: hypothetical protein NVV79_08375 [Devosia ginsengisoli]|nr:hypothetical protein [Devosia ginsengisoli]MCR6671351.1 hypothetical protein [Devosia ginsengisoli]